MEFCLTSRKIIFTSPEFKMKKTNPFNLEELKNASRKIRFRTIRNSYVSSTPHLGSCLSCIDILVYIYWRLLNINSSKPNSPERDRFILSKGHAAPAIFQILAERGFFDRTELESYGQDGSLFGEHPPTPEHLPGIEAATGSLGHGLPMGVGMALASKISKIEYKVYVVVGDGECNEGSIWEAAMLASANDLNNLIVFVDYNKWQATGRSNEIMALESLSGKWRAFGWDVFEINGHDFNAFEDLFAQPGTNVKPMVFVCHTIKGCGVEFMEDDNNWHYRIPTAEQVKLAAKELKIPDEKIQIENVNLIRH